MKEIKPNKSEGSEKSTKVDRRDFLKVVGATAGGLALASCAKETATPEVIVPPEKVSITFWHGEAVPERMAVFQEVLDNFMTENPNIEVIQEAVAWGDAYAKDPAAVQAGTLPDFRLTIGGHWMAMMETGAPQPVDDIIDDLTSKHKLMDRAILYEYEGHAYGVPLFMLTHTMPHHMCNIEGAGFSKAPEFWDELLAQAEALSNPDEGRYAMMIPASKLLWTDQCMMDMLAVNGVEDIFDDAGEVDFYKPKVVEAYEYYNQLLQFAYPDAASWGWGSASTQLYSGMGSFEFAFGSLWGQLPANAAEGQADCWRAAIIPRPTNGVKANVGYTNSFMVYTEDKTKQEAIHTFLSWLYEPENMGYMLAYSQPGLYLPVTEAALNSKAFTEHPILVRYAEVVPILIQSVEYSVEYGFMKGDANPKIGPISGDNTMGAAIQKVVVEGMDVDSAVKWAHDRMVELTS